MFNCYLLLESIYTFFIVVSQSFDTHIAVDGLLGEEIQLLVS